MADQHDPIPSGDPQDGEETNQRTKGKHAPGKESCDYPAHQGEWKAQEGHAGKPPVSQRDTQEEENNQRSCNPGQQKPVLGLLSFGIFTDHFRVVPDRVVNRGQNIFNFIYDRTKITTFYICFHIDAPRHVLMIDGIGDRYDVHPSHIFQGNIFTTRRFDQHLLDIGQALPRFWRAPNIHIIGPVGDMDIPDFFPSKHIGDCPTDIARFYSIGFSSSQINLNFDLRDIHQEFGM